MLCFQPCKSLLVLLLCSAQPSTLAQLGCSLQCLAKHCKRMGQEKRGLQTLAGTVFSGAAAACARCQARVWAPQVSLMDESGNTKDDLKLPTGTDDAEKLAEQLQAEFESGKEISVTVLKARMPA